MISEAKKRANAKYDKTHTRLITLKLNKKTDADILKMLDGCGNKQGYIKNLIRNDMLNRNSNPLTEIKEP